MLNEWADRRPPPPPRPFYRRAEFWLTAFAVTVTAGLLLGLLAWLLA